MARQIRRRATPLEPLHRGLHDSKEADEPGKPLPLSTADPLMGSDSPWLKIRSAPTHVLGEISTDGQNGHGLPLPNLLIRDRTFHRGTPWPFCRNAAFSGWGSPFHSLGFERHATEHQEFGIHEMPTAHCKQLAAAIALLSCLVAAEAADPIHKCVVNGTVTFQSSPCLPEKSSRQPTVDELNAARKKRLSEASAQAASAQPTRKVPPSATPLSSEPKPSASPGREASFRCDGRQHCSQMQSCSEAKFFLASCPGVKMDGNRDGTPCEQQWCTHPFAK